MAKNRVMEAKNAKAKKCAIKQRKERTVIAIICASMYGEIESTRAVSDAYSVHKNAQNMHQLSRYEMLLAANK